MTARPPVIGDGTTIRLSCCIPFCRRTFRSDKHGTPWAEGVRVMCGKHWRMGSAVLRRRDSRLARLQRRGVVGRHGSTKDLAEQIAYLRHRIWERVRIQATEAAVGIG